MAEFKPYAPEVEINGLAILSFIDAMEAGRDYRIRILKQHDIQQPSADTWHPQRDYLNALRQLRDEFGDQQLYHIGRAMPDRAHVPDQSVPLTFESLPYLVEMLSASYRMHHRGGEIGDYELLEFDLKAGRAVMRSTSPYPSEFDRGILQTNVRRMLADASGYVDVFIDDSIPNKRTGADADLLIINW